MSDFNEKYSVCSIMSLNNDVANNTHLSILLGQPYRIFSINVGYPLVLYHHITNMPLFITSKVTSFSCGSDQDEVQVTTKNSIYLFSRDNS